MIRSEEDDLEIQHTIDPTRYDTAMESFLTGINADKYSTTFRRYNIGQCALTQLTDDDLVKMGVDDQATRTKVLEEVKNLPLYDITKNEMISELRLQDIVKILESSEQHLHHIRLSMMGNIQALKKSRSLTDCLLYQDKYASDIALSTLDEITYLLKSMDKSVSRNFEEYYEEIPQKRLISEGKLILGGIVTTTIGIIAVVALKVLKHI